MTRHVYDKARVERCAELTERYMPAIRDAVKAINASGANVHALQANEQLECMETTLWLCRLVEVLSLPPTDAGREALAMRTMVIELGSILGGAKAMGDAMCDLGRRGVINGGQRTAAELFLADVERLIARIGEWFGPPPAHLKIPEAS